MQGPASPVVDLPWVQIQASWLFEAGLPVESVIQFALHLDQQGFALELPQDHQAHKSWLVALFVRTSTNDKEDDFHPRRFEISHLSGHLRNLKCFRENESGNRMFILAAYCIDFPISRGTFWKEKQTKLTQLKMRSQWLVGFDTSVKSGRSLWFFYISMSWIGAYHLQKENLCVALCWLEYQWGIE